MPLKLHRGEAVYLLSYTGNLYPIDDATNGRNG